MTATLNGYFNVLCWDANGERCFFKACWTFEQARKVWERECWNPNVELATVYHWPEWKYGHTTLLKFQREATQ